MSDELSRDERKRRGDHAERLLRDALLLEAFAAARDRFIEEMIEEEDETARTRAWAKLRGLAEARKTLFAWLQDGAVAAEAIKRSGG